MAEQAVIANRSETMTPSSQKRPYSPPASVMLSGGKDEEYGVVIGAACVWLIGIGPAWIW